MKIEMGESLMYSWLRHVKGCQIVQNNWKVSTYWILNHQLELEDIVKSVNGKFSGQYNIFKKNATIDQIIRQGECDALGICTSDGTLYGIDVAFHRKGTGLNYGSRTETVAKVLEKCIRTAMCFYGFFDKKDATVIFASPKIGQKTYTELNAAIQDLNNLFSSLGYSFTFSLFTNNDFKIQIIDPVLLASADIDDTAELFLRSYQLLELFNVSSSITKAKSTGAKSATNVSSALAAYKIGQLANVVLRNMLENGKASKTEILDMQTDAYSKNTFGLNYPLLVEDGQSFDKVRYYSKPLSIGGKDYYMCSQWFEKTANNDRLLLEKWIMCH